jgi:hypothetical protein
MQKVIIIICLFSFIFCVKARKSPFDPSNPISFLLSQLTLINSISELFPSVFYSNSNYTFYVNGVVSIIATTSNIQSCSVTPSLPSGLSLDSSNCNIKGTPTSSSSTQSYKIRAVNGSKTFDTTLTIGIESAYRMYVTSNYFNGSVTLSVADNNCNADTNKPSSGTYKALLVNGARRACSNANCSTGVSENLDWVLKASSNYIGSNGTYLIGITNESGIFSNGSLNSAISSFSRQVWTGLNSNFTNSANNCLNWTSNSAGNQGQGGISDSSSIASAFSIYASNCNEFLNLLCVEQ